MLTALGQFWASPTVSNNADLIFPADHPCASRAALRRRRRLGQRRREPTQSAFCQIRFVTAVAEVYPAGGTAENGESLTPHSAPWATLQSFAVRLRQRWHSPPAERR
jgi:hypothetical protein